MSDDESISIRVRVPMSDDESISISSNFVEMDACVERMDNQLNDVPFPSLDSIKPLVERSEEYVKKVLEENREENLIDIRQWKSVVECIWNSWKRLLYFHRFLDYDWTDLMERLEYVAWDIEVFLKKNMGDENGQDDRDMCIHMKLLRKIGERSADLGEDDLTSEERTWKRESIIAANKNRAAAAFELEGFVNYLHFTGRRGLYDEYLQAKRPHVRLGNAPDTNVNLSEIGNWVEDGYYGSWLEDGPSNCDEVGQSEVPAVLDLNPKSIRFMAAGNSEEDVYSSDPGPSNCNEVGQSEGSPIKAAVSGDGNDTSSYM